MIRIYSKTLISHHELAIKFDSPIPLNNPLYLSQVIIIINTSINIRAYQARSIQLTFQDLIQEAEMLKIAYLLDLHKRASP